MRIGCVYGLICPIQNKVLYIGITETTLSKRLAEHQAKKQAWKRSALNGWLNGLRESGRIKELKIVPIEENIPFENLHEREMLAIKLYSKTRALYNTSGTSRKAQITPKDRRGISRKKYVYPFETIKIGAKIEKVLKFTDRIKLMNDAKYYASRHNVNFKIINTGESVIIKHLPTLHQERKQQPN